MAKDEGTRLRKWDIDCAVAEDGGCALCWSVGCIRLSLEMRCGKGAYEGCDNWRDQVDVMEVTRMPEDGHYGGYTPEGPYEAPETDDPVARWRKCRSSVSKPSTEPSRQMRKTALDDALCGDERIVERHDYRETAEYMQVGATKSSSRQRRCAGSTGYYA
jgi:hypothetical protein